MKWKQGGQNLFGRDNPLPGRRFARLQKLRTSLIQGYLPDADTNSSVSLSKIENKIQEQQITVPGKLVLFERHR